MKEGWGGVTPWGRGGEELHHRGGVGGKVTPWGRGRDGLMK